MKRYLFLLFAVMLLGLAVDSASAANPTQQARYIAFRSVTATSIDLSFTRGNGAHRIVVVSTTDFPVNPADPTYKAPTNGVSYTQGATKGSFLSAGASTIGADGHVVYNSNEAGNTATERTLLISGLTPGTTYYIHIFEFNTPANPEYCINRGTVNNPANTFTAPQAPTITQGADLLSPNGFLANWDESAGLVDMYDFQLKDAFNGGGSNYWDDPGYADFNAPANDYPFSDLLPNHEYSYRVRSVKSYRYSAWTGWHNVKTMPEVLVTSSNGTNEACAFSTVTYTVNTPTGVSFAFGEWLVDGEYSELNPSAEPWTNQNAITWDVADENVEITTSYTDLLYGMDGDVPSALNNRGKLAAEPDFVELQNQYFVNIVNAPQPITEAPAWNLTPCEAAEVTYTVTAQPGMHFQWLVDGEPVGADQNSYTLTVPAPGVEPLQLMVYAYVATCTTDVYTQPLVISPLPTTPTSITMSEVLCEENVETFSTDAGAEGETFEWVFPEDWTLQGEVHNANSISVRIGTDAGTVQVRKHNDCGYGEFYSVDVTPTLLPRGYEILGEVVSTCEGNQMTFTVVDPDPNNFPDATFSWEVVNGMGELNGTGWEGTGTGREFTITAGQGDGIVLLTASNGTCGTINDAQNVYGTVLPTGGEFSTTNVEVNMPTVCAYGEMGTYNYVVSDVMDATTYEWTIPDGWLIVGPNNGPSIDVIISDTYFDAETDVQLSVLPYNGTCSAEEAITYNVHINPLPYVTEDAAISGPEVVCEGQEGIQFTITGVNNATGYFWTLPDENWVITGDETGATITVNLLAGASTGEVKALAANDCGDALSEVSFGIVTVNLLPNGYTWTVAPEAACVGDVVTYTVNGGTEATSYDWSVIGEGWSYVVDEVDPFTIHATAGTATCTIACIPMNGDCGQVAELSVNTTVTPLPSNVAINGSESVCKNSVGFEYSVTGTNITAQEWSFDEASQTAGWSITSDPTLGTVTVNSGSVAGLLTVSTTNGECSAEDVTITINVNDPPSGTSIASTSPVCEGSTQSYTLAGLANTNETTTYTWDAPADWGTPVLSNGNKTATYTVGQTSGVVSCYPANGDCVGETIETSEIVVNLLPINYTLTTAPTPVCEGSTQTYTVSGGTYGSTYNWTLPAGWSWDATDLNHTDANAIVVVGANGGAISCVPVSANGCLQATAASATIVVNPRPVGYTLTTAPTMICEGSTQTYIVSGGNYGATYNWTLPAGWSWDGGDVDHTNNTAIVIVGAGGGTISCVPVSANGCTQATAASALIEVILLPEGSISGPETVCANSTNNTYSIAEGSDISSYSWRVEGTGWSGTSGAPTFTPTAGTDNGTVYCTISNLTCSIAELSFPVSVIPTATATSINGDNTPCRNGQEVVYTLQNTNNVTDINWSVPVESGWSIVSAEGNSVTVNVGTAAGTITAQLFNGDCAGQTVSLVIETLKDVPANAGNIQGATAPCLGSVQSYSVTSVAGVTYEWTWPESWTNVTGNGSSSITATVNGSGTVTVRPLNNCGYGTMSQTNIAPITIPSATSAIEGMSIITPPGQYSYSVTNVPGVTYTWGAPANWEIVSGQGTNAVTYAVTTSSVSGYVTVTPSNACGAYPTATEKYVTVNVGPPAQPSLQATNIGFNGTTCSSVNLTWTNGDGNGRMVIAKLGQSPNNPTDLVRYNADSRFGRAATQIGTTGTYVVYKYMPGDPGEGNSCTVTNLLRGTMYYFKVIEFNYVDYNGLENGYNYNPNPAYLNPRSTTTRSACKEVETTTNPYAEVGLFTARSANGNGYLAWNTQYEQNVLGYEISRLCLSDKEENFTTISSYETNLNLVAENSNTNRDYRVTDNNVVTGKKYIYRLSYIGNDGSKNDVSEQTLLIDGATANSGALTISDVKPNPVKESVNFDVTTSEETEARFEIINMNGEVVASTTAKVKGTVLMNMPLDINVPSGSYMLKVSAGTETAVTRFVVVK